MEIQPDSPFYRAIYDQLIDEVEEGVGVSSDIQVEGKTQQLKVLVKLYKKQQAKIDEAQN